jgi:putative chitinase
LAATQSHLVLFDWRELAADRDSHCYLHVRRPTGDTMSHFDRDYFFTSVRTTLFAGSMSQEQVDGMNAILDAWEADYMDWDVRWLANSLGQTYHETSQEMQPIEEYGKGGDADYAKPDPETGECYYGRGFIQLTWRDNYARADDELALTGDESCELHAENALNPDLAACIMFEGMSEGWFRSDDKGRQNFERYFNDEIDDPYGAREIINGDKTKVPSWSNGVSIGNLIKSYHQKFLAALRIVEDEDEDTGEYVATVEVRVIAPKNVKVDVIVVEPEADETSERSTRVEIARTGR